MIIHKNLSEDNSYYFCVESYPYKNQRKWFYGEEYKTAPYEISKMCPIMIENGLKVLIEEIHAPYWNPSPFDSFDERERKLDLMLKDTIWIGKNNNDKYIALDRDSINHHHFDYISGFDSGYAIVYKTPKMYTKFNWEDDNKIKYIKGGWGIIDREGNLLTPTDYIFDEIWSFYDMGQKGTILHSNTYNPEGEYFYFRFKENEYDDEDFYLIENEKELKEYKEERKLNYRRYLGPEDKPQIEEDWRSYTSTGEEWENEDW